MVKHAVVDAIYAAKLAIDQGLPRFSVQPMLSIASAFSYLLREHADVDLATHAVTRELPPKGARALDAFMVEHGAWAEDLDECLSRCVASLPPNVRETVQLDVAATDFERV